MRDVIYNLPQGHRITGVMRGGNQYLHKVVDTLDSSWRGRGIESEACGGLGRLLLLGTREGPRDVVGKGRVATDGTWTARIF